MGVTFNSRHRTGSLNHSARSSSILSPSRRGALYLAALIFSVWLLVFRNRNAGEESELISSNLRDRAFLLASSINDDDVYGPPVKPSHSRFRVPTTSHMSSLRIWNETVPSTEIRAIAGGWTMFDNVILLNGTVYIISDDPKLHPELRLIFSTGVPMLSDPDSWAGKEVTPKEMQIVSTTRARTLFGNQASRIEGVTWLCNDAPQFVSHYYHFVAEILFGMWRTYSALDLDISEDGHTSLPPPRRFMFPRIPATEFNDYSGLSQYIMRAIFPSVGFEFHETWIDRSETNRPFILDRVVIGDRISAEHSPEWPGLYKYVAPPFGLPGSGRAAWWAPVRRGLLRFLDLDTRDAADDDKKKPAKAPAVITYVSRQGWNRRMLRVSDDAALVTALQDLHSRYGYEVNVVFMDQLSKREQLTLAARTTVMLGVHGNGLTHAVWMDPRSRPVLMEFFADRGFSTDYEYPMRELGITYYGWWGDKHFSHRNLPEVNFPEGFQGNDISIDGPAVARLIHQHIQSSAS